VLSGFYVFLRYLYHMCENCTSTVPVLYKWLHMMSRADFCRHRPAYRIYCTPAIPGAVQYSGGAGRRGGNGIRLFAQRPSSPYVHTTAAEVNTPRIRPAAGAARIECWLWEEGVLYNNEIFWKKFLFLLRKILIVHLHTRGSEHNTVSLMLLLRVDCRNQLF
jgi:hypothetical protein